MALTVETPAVPAVYRVTCDAAGCTASGTAAGPRALPEGWTMVQRPPKGAQLCPDHTGAFAAFWA